MTNVLDPAIRKTIDDAELEQEIERLMANRPQFREAVLGTEAAIEEGKARAITSSAAILTIYNRETGEPSQVIFDALKARMRQRFPADHTNPLFAGQRVYEMDRSLVPIPVRGDLACPLHFQNPSPEALTLGYGRGTRACKKPAYFTSEFDVELHVEKNHKRFHTLRQRAKAEREQREFMDLQRQTLLAMQAMAGKPAVSVSAKSPPEMLPCPKCGKECKSQFGLDAHMRSHKET